MNERYLTPVLKEYLEKKVKDRHHYLKTAKNLEKKGFPGEVLYFLAAAEREQFFIDERIDPIKLEQLLRGN